MEELFKKYFEGVASPAEEKELWAFVRQCPENAKAFRNAEYSWRKTHAPTSFMDRDFSSVIQAIRSRRSRRAVIWISAVAASLVVFAIVGYSLLRDKTYSFETLAGNVSEIVLPDGTSVSLNSGSTMQYTAGRKSKNRLVSLSGEAYFEVVSDPDHPFVVNTEDFSITVLGTKFMVSDYPEDKLSQVSLTEGSIELNSGTDSRKMLPGDTVICDGENIFDSRQDSLLVCQWSSDIISYDNIELGDFINRLVREFNVDLILEAKGFAHESFRASFSRSDSIESILETVCNVFPLTLSKNGNTYSLIFTKSN